MGKALVSLFPPSIYWIGFLIWKLHRISDIVSEQFTCIWREVLQREGLMKNVIFLDQQLKLGHC